MTDSGLPSDPDFREIYATVSHESYDPSTHKYRNRYLVREKQVLFNRTKKKRQKKKENDKKNSSKNATK